MVLVKNKDCDGEGVKKCPNCKASWFLLLCRPPSKEWQEKEDELERTSSLQQSDRADSTSDQRITGEGSDCKDVGSVGT
jgi:hypothetical protein